MTSYDDHLPPFFSISPPTLRGLCSAFVFTTTPVTLLLRFVWYALTTGYQQALSIGHCLIYDDAVPRSAWLHEGGGGGGGYYGGYTPPPDPPVVRWSAVHHRGTTGAAPTTPVSPPPPPAVQGPTMITISPAVTTAVTTAVRPTPLHSKLVLTVPASDAPGVQQYLQRARVALRMSGASPLLIVPSGATVWHGGERCATGYTLYADSTVLTAVGQGLTAGWGCPVSAMPSGDSPWYPVVSGCIPPGSPGSPRIP